MEQNMKGQENRGVEKVLVFGRGAVGVALCQPLADNLESENFAFYADENRKERYEKNGLIVNGTPVNFRYVSSLKEFGPADLVLFFTKYKDLKEAMEQAAPFITDQTILMCGTNGICSEEDLKACFPKNDVIRSIAQRMDAAYRDNEVRFTTPGELVFGAERPDQKPDVRRVKDLFTRNGLPYRVSNQIVHDQWNKLMVNCGLNQICAGFDLTYGALAASPEHMALFHQAMQEVAAVAHAQGIELSEEERKKWSDDLLTYAPDSMPSMRQDILAGRPTEKVLFSGTVVPLGKKAGIDCPVLALLYEKVEERENEKAQSV